MILIILSFTHGAPIKAKLWLEESSYCKHGTNAFQKMGAEFYMANHGKGMCSILSSRLWGGALHYDTKNGCVADYLALGLCVNYPAFLFCWLQFSVKWALVNNSTNSYESMNHNYHETIKTTWIENKPTLKNYCITRANIKIITHFLKIVTGPWTCQTSLLRPGNNLHELFFLPFYGKMTSQCKGCQAFIYNFLHVSQSKKKLFFLL